MSVTVTKTGNQITVAGDGITGRIGSTVTVTATRSLMGGGGVVNGTDTVDNDGDFEVSLTLGTGSWTVTALTAGQTVNHTSQVTIP